VAPAAPDVSCDIAPDVSCRIEVSWDIPVVSICAPVLVVAPGDAGLLTAPADVSVMLPAFPLFPPPEHAATSNAAATSVMYLMFWSSSK